MRTEPISQYDDIVDSRDVIARIAELESDEARDGEDERELNDLRELARAVADYASDWEYGTTLIRDSYFVEYAQELAEDLGVIDSHATWPNDCIDWDKAARELKCDYSVVSWGGIDYWIHC